MRFLPDGRTAALSGALFIAAAWFVFALHDASIKLLVADLSAWQILFMRSAIVLPVCMAATGCAGMADAWNSPVRGRLVLCAVVYAAAWLAYYTAARHLQLAELETIYFASPFIGVVLAVLILKETVPWPRWTALAIGFAGVILACQPADPRHSTGVALALLGAALWAYAIVLVRQLAPDVPTRVQMLLNNATFLVLSGLALPWWWQLPDMRELVLLLGVAACGTLGQYLLYEGLRHAPVSVAAPLEFTGLLWSFALGYAIWGDVPAAAVFIGAGLVLVSGVLVLAAEWRERSAPAAPPSPAAPSPAA